MSMMLKTRYNLYDHYLTKATQAGNDRCHILATVQYYQAQPDESFNSMLYNRYPPLKVCAHIERTILNWVDKFFNGLAWLLAAI